MASTADFLNFILSRISSAGEITYKSTQGNYNIYCNGKMVALIREDRLFVKNTEAGKLYMKKYLEVPPYSGARPCLLITDLSDELFVLADVIRITYDELPLPSRKSTKKD
ncbi:MAG: competence protein TfoX [Ruminococcaceae bacterium]|nr:competence protein TfoX [Oscillospiraceae bacterium]